MNTQKPSLSPLGVTTKEAIAAIRSEKFFYRALSAGWIKPHIKGKGGRRSFFNASDVEKLFNRLGRELPPLLPSEKKRQAGFTLTETMGVVAIILVLSAGAILAFGLNRCASAETAFMRECQTLNSSYQNYIAAGGNALAADASTDDVYTAVTSQVNGVGPFLVRPDNTVPTFQLCSGPVTPIWTVNGFGSPSPTPATPSPSPTATATPTPTPTATPSPSPSPTATPAPTATATPSPTPIASDYSITMTVAYRGITLPDVITATVTLTNRRTEITPASIFYNASGIATVLGTTEPSAVVSSSGFNWSGNLAASGTKAITVYLWPNTDGTFAMSATSGDGVTVNDNGVAYDPQSVAYDVFIAGQTARSQGYVGPWATSGAGASGSYGVTTDTVAGAIQQMLTRQVWTSTAYTTGGTVVPPPSLENYPPSTATMPQPAYYKTGLKSYLYSSTNSGYPANPSVPADNLLFRQGDWSWPGWSVAVPGKTINQTIVANWSTNYRKSGANWIKVRGGYANPYQ